MNDSIAYPVVVGLAVGIGFLVIFSLISIDKSAQIKRNASRLFDTSYIELDDHKLTVLDIMIRNSTVMELVQGQNMSIQAVSDVPCSFGPCAFVLLSNQNNLTQSVHVFVDYNNDKVILIRHSMDAR
ncbi:MAG TPA: hypothetical protein VHK86_03775 [Nitrososphaera sp.]|jgi:hypothetical protein|nr:hypothetical protein [Nitrososphaera sp.]